MPRMGPCYASELEAAEEAGCSRIFQGMHFQFSNEDGRRGVAALDTRCDHTPVADGRRLAR